MTRALDINRCTNCRRPVSAERRGIDLWVWFHIATGQIACEDGLEEAEPEC